MTKAIEWGLVWDTIRGWLGYVGIHWRTRLEREVGQAIYDADLAEEVSSVSEFSRGFLVALRRPEPNLLLIPRAEFTPDLPYQVTRRLLRVPSIPT